MAFRREALQAINGFDPQYRKAGDDVDVCWRLQQAGLWITFAPGAFVWHHRRQSPRAYLRQQAGYGEAEALLRFKHPDRFNGRGDGKWRGVLYGAVAPGPAARRADHLPRHVRRPGCSSASTSRARPTGPCSRPRWSGTPPPSWSLRSGRCGCRSPHRARDARALGPGGRRSRPPRRRCPRDTADFARAWSSPACATPSRWFGPGSGIEPVSSTGA